jgi:hypothetical protein
MGETDILNKQKIGFHPSICANVHPDNHTGGSETSKAENSTYQEHTAGDFTFSCLQTKINKMMKSLVLF